MILIGSCDYKGSYLSPFIFLLSDLLQLYNALLNWIKILSECHETIRTDIILSRSRPLEVYRWQKTLEEGAIIIKLLLEKNGSIIYELKFNYDHFNKFVQSLYFLTWQAMCVKDQELGILIKLIALPFTDLFELKNPSKLLSYLKTITTKPNYYSFIIQFHLETIFFLHKIYRIINTDSIDERLNLLCTS